ncbi:hypothetical protein BANRA_03363 [Acinetobacter baumannii]|nr:hypothetical protein BANRA_03363 [Acinetobacter baumannii]
MKFKVLTKISLYYIYCLSCGEELNLTMKFLKIKIFDESPLAKNF